MGWSAIALKPGTPASKQKKRVSFGGFPTYQLSKHLTNILKPLRVNVSKNQRNRGHSSKFNFAHTLAIGRPKSHTYDKDVRLLKFSLVWEILEVSQVSISAMLKSAN